ncbi:protein disulfide oxidoreductase [Shewanella gaetbuli]
MLHKPTFSQRLKTKSFWLKQLRDIGVVALILFAIASYLQRDMITGTAPALNATTINHHTVQLSQTTPTIVYFWGTWCAVCKVTSPMVNSVAKSDKYQVISIAVASGSNQDISYYMQQNGLDFPVINEASIPPATDTLSQQWGANAFPAIYIVDKNHQIRFITSGVTTSWGLKFRLWAASYF